MPCVEQPETLCARIYDVTGQRWLGGLADWFLAKPLKIVAILVLAIVVRALLHRVIARLAARISAGIIPGALARGRAGALVEAGPLAERREQRAATMASVLRSLTTGVLLSVAFVMVLDELGLPVAPLLASAGVAGVALGFGAQSLVKDFLSGIFMILEDQYGVGDVVDVGDVSGSVESVGLRVTRLRDVNGAVWYVRNGEIIRVGNMSQGWARAVVDVGVGYGEDIARVRELLGRVADELWHDPQFGELVLEQPEVWGVEAMSAEAVVVRIVVKTAPLKQWDVARELRQRVMAAFTAHGVAGPLGQRPVFVRADGPAPPEPDDGDTPVPAPQGTADPVSPPRS